MGCVCCSLSSFVSILLDSLERISLCTVCAMLVCCLTYTLLTMMILGVGIGYHYCFVQNSVDAMAKAAKSAGALRSGPEATEKGHVMRSIDKMVNRGFAHRMSRRDADDPVHTNITNNDIETSKNYSISHPIPSNDTVSQLNSRSEPYFTANDTNHIVKGS